MTAEEKNAFVITEEKLFEQFLRLLDKIKRMEYHLVEEKRDKVEMFIQSLNDCLK